MSAILRRKIAASQPPSQIRHGALQLLPLSVARSARTGLALDITCGDAGSDKATLAELLEMPAEGALILLLEGPGGGGGMLAMCPAMLAALIEVQTLGCVNTHPILPRRPTRTDAAMVSDWVDALLIDLEDALACHEDLTWVDGFRVSGHLVDTRPLGLMLEDVAYQALRLTCDLARVREGSIVLALPADGRGRKPKTDDPVEQSSGPADTDFGPQMAARVLAARAEVQASLLRLRLPLAELNGLRAGQMLPLPMAALDRIEILGIDGVSRAVGRLGQQGGQRAVRITQCEEVRAASADPAVVLPALARAS